jgi:hypothetical protein
MSILERLARPYNQQASGVPRFDGMQSNQIFRKVEVEFGNAHGGSLARVAWNLNGLMPEWLRS